MLYIHHFIEPIFFSVKANRVVRPDMLEVKFFSEMVDLSFQSVWSAFFLIQVSLWFQHNKPKGYLTITQGLFNIAWHNQQSVLGWSSKLNLIYHLFGSFWSGKLANTLGELVMNGKTLISGETNCLRNNCVRHSQISGSTSLKAGVCLLMNVSCCLVSY